jgi:hypothetical protein
MKLEIGKKYKDEIGNIIDVVYAELKGTENRTVCAVICENEDNSPTWFPLDGMEMQIGSMLHKKIIECLGDCEMPIFKKVKNRKGQEIDYLTNYKSTNGFHLGIIHMGENEDAIRCFSEKGEIEVPMKQNGKYEESISSEQLK